MYFFICTHGAHVYPLYAILCALIYGQLRLCGYDDATDLSNLLSTHDIPVLCHVLNTLTSGNLLIIMVCMYLLFD